MARGLRLHRGANQSPVRVTSDLSWLADLIGAPFVPGGRGPGYDCYGLVREAARRLGIALPEYAYPLAAVTVPAEIAGVLAEAMPTWQPCGPEVGAVAAIRNAPGLVNHCGIVIAPGLLLHTLAKIGAYTVPLDSPAWRHRIVGYYRWPS